MTFSTKTRSNFESGKATVTISGKGVTVGKYSTRAAKKMVFPLTIASSAAKGERTVTIQKGSLTLTGTRTAGKVNTDTTLYVTLPISGASAGVYNLTVTNSAGPQATKKAAFTVIANQGGTITSVSPKTGARTSDRPIEITGSGFKPGAAVILTNGVIRFRITSGRLLGSTSILVTLPLKTSKVAAGVYSIVVINPDSTFGTKNYCYTVTSKPMSAVVSVTNENRSVSSIGKETSSESKIIIPGFIRKNRPQIPALKTDASILRTISLAPE